LTAIFTDKISDEEDGLKGLAGPNFRRSAPRISWRGRD
jgi:hypothetical protein